MKSGLIILLASAVAAFGQCSFTFDIASQGSLAAVPCPYTNALYSDNTTDKILTFSNADATGTNVTVPDFNCYFSGATVYEMSFDGGNTFNTITGLQSFSVLTNLTVNSADINNLQDSFATNLYALESLTVDNCSSLVSPFSVKGITNLLSISYNDAGLDLVDIDGCTQLTNIQCPNNGLTGDTVNYYMTNLDAMGRSNGAVNCTAANGVSTVAGVTSGVNLLNKGWSLGINWYNGLMIGWSPDTADSWHTYNGNSYTESYAPFIQRIIGDYSLLTKIALTNQTIDFFRLGQDVTNCTSCNVQNCSLTQTDVDTLYADLVTMGASNGTLLLWGNSAPSSNTDHDTLVDRGWTIGGP